MKLRPSSAIFETILLLVACWLILPRDSTVLFAQPTVMTKDFGSIKLYELTNAQGMQVGITNYGAIIQSIRVPDRAGMLADVVLGHNDLAGYINAIDRPYLGAIVGRYGNRIAEAKFSIDGQNFQLAANNGPHSLHGGIMGFDKVVWTGKPVGGSDWVGVELKYLAKDGEEGFPGNLDVSVTYRLTNDNAIEIDFLATTDKTTPVNLTQHSYFNLKGEGEGDILDHQLMINGDRFTPVDETLIPTGEILVVDESPLDFRQSKTIGRDIELDHPQLKHAGGFDHNWVLNEPIDQDGLRLAAELFEPASGRVLTVYTQEPGLQFYSGNFLDGRIVGKSGQPYVRRGGLCLETQHFPDSPNQKNFPSTLLRPGEIYQTKTLFRFSVR